MTKNEKRALVVMCMAALEHVGSEAIIKKELGLSTLDLEGFYDFLCKQDHLLHGAYADFKEVME